MTSVEVLKAFFADVRPLTTQELRALPATERQVLAALTAEQLGLSPVEHEGHVSYRPAA